MDANIGIICFKSKVLANGEHPLMLRISQGKLRYFKSLGISIKVFYVKIQMILDYFVSYKRKLFFKSVTVKFVCFRIIFHFLFYQCHNNSKKLVFDIIQCNRVLFPSLN
ncbi:Arm DNA-binding domain protein [Bacteroides finegoldii]|uniref:Arm DNA-binding domain-containing protein n=1 Tax=Bacteroides finegoldii CL09T03C10 TaxID=997888 RepID=K5D8S4_9BACE|nr:hypothetical protein HMPREF1057_04081 [Bacteroides finegoldii CL09T03C10]